MKPVPAAVVCSSFLLLAVAATVAAVDDVDPAVQGRGPRQRGYIHFRSDALQSQDCLCAMFDCGMVGWLYQ